LPSQTPAVCMGDEPNGPFTPRLVRPLHGGGICKALHKERPLTFRSESH
jgi:hypothetical protein